MSGQFVVFSHPLALRIDGTGLLALGIHLTNASMGAEKHSRIQQEDTDIT